MKRTLSVVMIFALLLSCLAFGSFQTQALEDNATYVPAFSFDFLEEGMQPGGLDDEGTDGESKYVNCQNTVGVYFDTLATTEGAFYGKALEFKSVNGGDGVYVPITMAISQTNPKRTDFEGATDFVCYIDTRNWGTARGIRPVLSVNGLDAAGELTGVTNTYFPADDKPAYIQDADKNWVQIEKVESGTLQLAKDYVGFIRVPIDSFTQTEWDSEDANGKLDLKEVVSIATEVGCYKENDGNKLIIDEIGFLGDFEDGIKQSFLKDGKVDNGEDATSGEAASGDNDSKKDGSISPMIWLLIAAGVVVVAAIIIIVVVLNSSKKKAASKNDEKAEDDTASSDNPPAENDKM